MSLQRKIRLLRVWRSHAKRIQMKWYLKSEVIFGSDSLADIRIEETPNARARLDFETSELYWIDLDRTDSIPSGEIFQLGDLVFQWKEWEIPSRKHGLLFATTLAGVLILLTASRFLSTTEPKPSPCTTKALALFQETPKRQWLDRDREYLENFDALKNSFKVAIRAKEILKARSELGEIERQLELESRKGCETLPLLTSFEKIFLKAVVYYHLESRNGVEAAVQLQSLKAKNSSENFSSIEERIIRLARKTYLEGYRLEERDAATGDELMNRAQKVCEILDQKRDCFKRRSTKSREQL